MEEAGQVLEIETFVPFVLQNHHPNEDPRFIYSFISHLYSLD
jgi:hypothetical protein